MEITLNILIEIIKIILFCVNIKGKVNLEQFFGAYCSSIRETLPFVRVATQREKSTLQVRKFV